MIPKSVVLFYSREVGKTHFFRVKEWVGRFSPLSREIEIVKTPFFGAWLVWVFFFGFFGFFFLSPPILFFSRVHENPLPFLSPKSEEAFLKMFEELHLLPSLSPFLRSTFYNREPALPFLQQRPPLKRNRPLSSPISFPGPVQNGQLRVFPSLRASKTLSFF